MGDKKKLTKKELLKRIEELEENNKKMADKLDNAIELIKSLIIGRLNSNYGITNEPPNLYFGHQVFDKNSEEWIKTTRTKKNP